MALSSAGLRPTCHLAPFVSDVITLSRPCIPPLVVFPKPPLSVLCFLLCTLPPKDSHLLPFPEPPPLCRRHPTVFFILPSQLRLERHSPTKCPSANLFLDDSQCPISQFPQKLNSYSLDSKTNLTGYTTPHLAPPTLLATLASSSLMSFLTSPVKFRPSPKPAITTVDSFVIRPCLHSTTACTTVTSIVHSKLDYCNSLCYSLPKSQITSKHVATDSELSCSPPRSYLLLPTLSSMAQNNGMHRIQTLLTHKVLTITQPPYLLKLISVQPPRSTRSSSLVTLARSPTYSFLYTVHMLRLSAVY